MSLYNVFGALCSLCKALYSLFKALYSLSGLCVVCWGFVLFVGLCEVFWGFRPPGPTAAAAVAVLHQGLLLMAAQVPGPKIPLGPCPTLAI